MFLNHFETGWPVASSPTREGGIEFIGAWHALHDAKLGETDLLFTFRSTNSKIYACFLEDKIDAFFTDRQAERYKIRAERHIASNKCHAAITCLLAPQRYINAHPTDAVKFDKTLFYEEIRDQIRKETDTRSSYRARFIQEAIEQNRRGYVSIPDENVSAFWKSLWHICNRRTPELKMKLPKDRPISSTFIYFTDCLSKGVRIVWKHRFDVVDLQFSGTDVASISRKISGRLEEGMMVVPAKKSAAIRIRVPHVEATDPFEPQVSAVENALDSSSRLLRFLKGMRRSC